MHLLTIFDASFLAEWQVTAGCVIFLVCYLVFAIGKLPGMKIDRPGAAIIGAVAMVATRIVRPGEALRFIDFSTIVLLFCMMLLVGYLHLAGFFEWITALIVRHLPPRHLLPMVIFTSGVLSAFFVNDIICLVMVPFVLTTTRRMGLKPVPYLLAVATASNIGSVATITGNPQNMLIGSFSRISYRDFLAHLGPVAIIGLLLDWLVLSLFVSHSPSHVPSVAAASGERATGNGQPSKRHLLKPGIVIALVLAGFIAGVPPAMMAAIGAAVMLITRTREPQHVYNEVNWDLLVFFAGLFLIVGGAENSGLTQHMFSLIQRWNLQHAAVFTVAVAALSNVVSNVPAVMLLKSLVPSFRDPHSGWLLLAMASTLAGNLTITGSVANLIVVERARGEAHIGFWDYFKVGLPVTVLTLAAGWAWLRFTC
jgi:Na+/H+ antiporter NhaD/arsenite permease-like protein